MNTLINQLLVAMARIREEEEGQGLVEYGLILSLVSVVCIATLGPLGTAISGLFTEVTGVL